MAPSTESIVIRVRSGDPPPDPPGRHCRDQGTRYTLTLKAHELAWDYCYADAGGKRVLASSEVAALDQMLAQLNVVEGEGPCPDDASSVSVTTKGEVTREYHDDLCRAEPPLLDSRALERLLKLLANLAEK